MALTRINNQALTNVTSAGLPSGTVLQVKSFTFKAITSTTNIYTSYADTGITINITPTSSSSKILIQSSIMVANQSTFTFLQLQRDGTNICIGDAAGSRERCTTMSYPNGGTENNTTETVGHVFLDSPNTTSQITYKWQFANTSSSYSSKINTHVRDNNNAYEPRGTSTITVMEIAG